MPPPTMPSRPPWSSSAAPCAALTPAGEALRAQLQAVGARVELRHDALLDAWYWDVRIRIPHLQPGRFPFTGFTGAKMTSEALRHSTAPEALLTALLQDVARYVIREIGRARALRFGVHLPPA